MNGSNSGTSKNLNNETATELITTEVLNFDSSVILSNSDKHNSKLEVCFVFKIIYWI